MTTALVFVLYAVFLVAVLYWLGTLIQFYPRFTVLSILGLLLLVLAVSLL